MNTPNTQSPATHSGRYADSVLHVEVRNLRVGQRVDLEGDDVADPDYVASDGEKSAHPGFAYEFEVVASIEHESDECAVVYFESGFACGFPPDHEVEVDPEQTFDAPNWPGSPDPANPDNAWIDDATGESVDAFGVRTQLYYECAICGAFHRLNFTGDCRQDSERFEDVPPESIRNEDSEPLDVRSSIDHAAELTEAIRAFEAGEDSSIAHLVDGYRAQLRAMKAERDYRQGYFADAGCSAPADNASAAQWRGEHGRPFTPPEEGDVQSSIDYADERKQAIEDAVEAALNAGCKAIQDRLGVTSGDLAGMHFSGDDASDPLREVFGSYFDAELDRGANRV